MSVMLKLRNLIIDTYQCNRIESPEINSSQLIFRKGADTMQWKKEKVFLIIGDKQDICIKKMNLDFEFTLYTTTNSRRALYLNVKL